MYTNEIDDESQTSNYNSNSGNKIKIIIIAVLVIIAIILLILALTKGKSKSSSNEKYTITIYPDPVLVSFGESKSISYEVRNSKEVLPNAVIRLTSADESIAIVDNLIIKGVNYGKTILTVAYVDDNGTTTQELKEVIVADGDPNIKIENVVFPEGDLKLPSDGEYQLDFGIEPENGYVESKKFVSSNTNVVTVDEYGKVTAVGEGEATITININNGAYKKVLKVYVNSSYSQSEMVVSPNKVIISNPISSIKEGETEQLTYSVTPEDAITNVTWTSSNESVISIDRNGIISGIKAGTAIIKVTTDNGLSDSMTIEVTKKEVLVTDILLSISDIALTSGQSETITVSVSPEEATNKALTFESSDTSIISVIPSSDTSATIRAISPGIASVIIRSSNGIEKMLNVTVMEDATVDPGSSSSGGGGGSSCGSCSKVTCGAGKYCSCGKCYSCPEGYYCANNKKTECPSGKSSVPNSSSYQDCYVCSKGYYLSNHKCTACPSGTTTKSSGATSKNDCVKDPNATPTPTPKATPVDKCNLGQYVNNGKCETCPKGKYCKDGKNTYNCPAGKGKATGAKFSVNCLLCKDGYISAAGKECKECASGKSNSTRTACVE